MKHKLAGFILFLMISFESSALANKLTHVIAFADVEKAKELLVQDDAFTNSWSTFDIDARMHKKNSTKEELFRFISEQCRSWTNKEKEKINSACADIEDHIKIQGLKLDFPEEVLFIKTTAREEGGAGGYTRSSYIVLKDDVMTMDDNELTRIITHELFHILTRNNQEFRKAMYKIIGFKLMNSEDYPDVIKPYRITNPDAPQTDSYITLKVDGQSVDCMMILFANQAYSGGDFFQYLRIGFLKLQGDSIKSAAYLENKPVIFTLNQVNGFYEQVGKNTQYIIHPEEIMADNFTFAILNIKELPNPEIPEAIKAVLQE
ncbi:hypothetical protein [Saccharicrinis sp. FJH54]|uniref:hypothetical protein n=1 Tax=Saccharicrinis sp. FJH54 TaxID=3344665 RepID=UPI0035D4E518